MNVILLSGGSGKRLWPLSNDVRAKQFIKLFDGKNGEKESMVQRMYRGIRNEDSRANIVIATNKKQIAEIQNQIAGEVHMSIEPCKKNTFPAILLAACYMHEKIGVSEDEAVVVCPVDSYLVDSYFSTVARLYSLAEERNNNLCLMGVAPTSPSEKYGYIIPKSKDYISEVITFKEKPDKATAMEYIKRGALWNSGVFAFKLKYLLRVGHEMIHFKDYEDLLEIYETLEDISFDYAVVEKEKSITVLKHLDKWDDLGTWDSLTSKMSSKTVGLAKLEENCINTNVINELNIPIICLGTQNLVVAASLEGILVTDKAKSDKIKNHVDDLIAPIRHAEKSWGNYSIVDVSEHSTTMKIHVDAGKHMSYHAHEKRDEVWIVVSGKGQTIVDGMTQNVDAGDILAIASGSRHTIIADTSLDMIEIQIGDNIDVKDKKKFEIE